jgi:hypothetical protein
MSNDIRSILDRLATVEGHRVKSDSGTAKGTTTACTVQTTTYSCPGRKDRSCKHPMDGYMVGDSVEPRRTALEEAMAEIEEDMLSKVKKDLTQYLDRVGKESQHQSRFERQSS